MSQRLVIFDLTSLLRLLTYYTDGQIPLTAEPLSFEASPILQRYLSMLVSSPEWAEAPRELLTGELPPYHFRYEGKRAMRLDKAGDAPEWGAAGAIEAPRRQ